MNFQMVPSWLVHLGTDGLISRRDGRSRMDGGGLV
jgi:hypothetical protein